MKAIVVMSAVTSFLIRSGDWSYDNLDEWPETCLNGTTQSPINLEKASATRRNFSEIVFNNFYNVNVTLQNTGHTVQVTISEDDQNTLSPNITGGVFGTNYYFLDNLHFHWNSEHTIDGYRYPLEGHFLLYNHSYGNITNALNYIHGFAVISVMYEIEDSCTYNSFEDITETIDDISKNVSVSVRLRNKISIHSLLPTTTNKVFVYNGSLTTPDCNEGALWVVLEEPSCIKQSQYEKLSGIYSDRDALVEQNTRPLQDLYGREILYSGTAAMKKKFVRL
ncbi:hypothetical protein NQ317_004798 [Molorchus minor]|uniref:Carbonic anhydrase n=1 Tax=Molorchus minor TaxID=1323400 RepID=A0ABQ9JRA1_9CUCU|nr:hypothetical protein NQ317_004798 [Molorchus minor]